MRCVGNVNCSVGCVEIFSRSLTHFAREVNGVEEFSRVRMKKVEVRWR